MQHHDDYLNKKQAAVFIGVCVATLDRFRLKDDYHFPVPLRPGARRLLWKREELREWIESRRAER